MSDVLEPCVLRGTSTVLRGPGSSNVLPATRLGFVGTKAEAEEIKRQLGEFLQDELKLELSQAKTLITHAKSEAARFLGYGATRLVQTGLKSQGTTR